MVLNDVDYRSCVGKICKSVGFGDFRIVKYENALNVDIMFLETGFTKTCQMSNIRQGRVKDMMKPSVVGVGITGSKYQPVSLNHKGEYETCHAYVVWRNLLERCYLEKKQKVQPTYKGCTVSDNFKSYEYFYEWCLKQIGYNEKGFELDKDLLVKGNKVYSENTCCFVPKEINTALTKRDGDRGECPIGVYWNKDCEAFVAKISEGGERRYLGLFSSKNDAFNAYKVAKEKYMKKLASKWVDRIDKKVYQALIEYEVRIND